MEAGMAKYFASEAALENSTESMRIHGAYGYSKEYDIERLYRDAPLTCIGEGTNEMQRLIIARQVDAPDARHEQRQAARGIRVLTLEQFGAGPYGTMFMAELGAEVIKVEAPDGDPSRQVGPYRLGKDDSEYFQAWNLGKKSVTLDLKSAAGRAKFEALVKTADCVVNNMRGTQPGQARHRLCEPAPLKPSIVCLHISAYGRANERADWPGYDS
jgi:hypothetical protein